jgi:hypothetical protein
MTPPIHLGIVRAAGAILSLCLLGACVTKREAKGNVRTSFGFDSSAWGGAAGGDDSDKIRTKFAESGWKVDETGQLRPTNEKNADLYKGKSVRRGRDFAKTDAKLGNREAKTKAFRTPEYLERQTFQTKAAKGADSLAREGAFDSHRATESGRAAKTAEKPGILAGLNPFRGETARESDQNYRTTANREGSRAQENAAVATGVRQSELGFYKDSVRTMDDVKRLLHPEAFD